MDNVRLQLHETEDKLGRLRSEKSRLGKIFESAKLAYEATDGDEGDPTFKTAAATKESLQDVETQIEQVADEQVRLLKRIGDAEAGMGGLSLTGSNGYTSASRKIDLAAGVNRADVLAASLLRAQVPGGGAGSSTVLRAPEAPATAVSGPYYAYQAFGRQDAGGAASVTEFTVSFSEGAVTGMERAPAAVTNKPTLPGTYALATPDVRQHAIVAEDIPVRLLDTPAFGSFLDVEMRRQVDLSVDRHVLAQINAANPPSGSSGSGLIEKIRNAVASSRALGSWPSVILLSPTDASALDLSTTGTDDMLVFAVRDTGSSSPIWALRVVESAAVTNPLLLDPGRLGVLYVGSGSVTVDDLSGLKTNVARIRTELEALLHVRCAQAAFEIV